MNVDHVQAKRHFCNKIWNGFKFVTSYTDTVVDHRVPLSQCKDVMDKWILSRLSNLVDLCQEGFVSYDLQFCTKALQNFWVGDFCDIYLVCAIHVVTNIKICYKITANKNFYAWVFLLWN